MSRLRDMREVREEDGDDAPHRIYTRRSCAPYALTAPHGYVWSRLHPVMRLPFLVDLGPSRRCRWEEDQEAGRWC